ncbi:glycoside hydrolase family 15 protein [Aureimonas mangrovi]|uniref:glycoside hydrolase family 15 protein n=1 Tax=Aureimonas mangrovi TaxID=2758041 RepID=UPI001FEA6079|nr:glycoside hydrolase family 15 protein [Aureimonas mangrovi]
MPNALPKPRNPIDQHGVIGDMRTLALVTPDGRIDFFSYPEIDSPTLFASLLDEEKGGEFRLWMDADQAKLKQIYLPDTNILLNRFLTDGQIGEVTEFMPLDGSGRIIRRARAIVGSVDFLLKITPAPDYARQTPRYDPVDGGGVKVSWGDGDDAVYFYASAPVEIGENGIGARIRLKEDETCHVVMCPGRAEVPKIDENYVAEAFRQTSDFWHNWVRRGTYPTYWRELVVRSALTLKLLTSSKHGSIAAAATFGLPETPGGERNWDYRFCWVRDSAFTLYALSRLNYYDEAEAFMHFLMERAVERAPHLQIMYKMDGQGEPVESELDHLSGYMASRPVRIGNGAFDQRQMDIYGELLDSIYISTRARGKPSYSVWTRISGIVDWLCDNWRLPDRGIWESRGEDREYLSSRLMSWVALDRGMRIAARHSLPADIVRWRVERDRIQKSIVEEFWNEEVGAFTQVKGGTGLDAVVLLMPLVRFINPRDPMWTSTLRAVRRELVHDCLVMRYHNTDENPDGLEGEEGAFTICSFWYIEALARTGYTAEARLLFEKLHAYANHLGLYSEELSKSGEHLGNFPQALTHLSLISAAIWLDRALNGDRQDPTNATYGILEDPDGIT